MITNQRELRRMFWKEHKHLSSLHKRTVKFGDHRDYPADVRVQFCDWLDQLHREGLVSDKLAQNATL